MTLYFFAAPVPFKVGSTSIAAKAIYIAFSIGSAWGSMLGGFATMGVDDHEPSPNKRSGFWVW